MRNGERISGEESTTLSATSSSRRSLKYLPTTHNTTTKWTRSEIPVPNLFMNGADSRQDGRPVYIEQYGKVDLNAMYKITSQERMLSNLVVEYEKVSDPRLPACSRKAGALLETCCTIMDMKGVGLTKAPSVYSYMQQASAISQNYYPERLGKLYIINAPWGFSSVFSIVKGFLDPITVQKIHVLGSGYKAELLKQIDADQLPESLGGTCKCDGGCEHSDKGPWHDPEFAKPAAWEKEKKAEENTISNEPAAEAGSTGGAAAPVEGKATAEAGKDDKATAAA